MIAGMNLQWFAQFSAERLLNGVVEGAGIALFAWVLLRLIGKQNSGTRFAVWFSALIAVAVLPFSRFLAPAAVGASGRAEFMIPSSWANYLFAAWAVVAAAGLARVGVGLWQVRRLKTECVPVPLANLDETLQKTLREFDSLRKVRLCTSDDLRMPTAVGFIHPMVVIPSWAMQELSSAEVNSILLHELAHLRRWDDCTNLAQKILGALLFFHPAVWWIERKLALEREMACDDLVLARTENPRAYAECLVSLAEKGFLRRGLALAQAAVSRMHDTSLRIRQILDGGRPSTTAVWMPALLLVSGFAFAFTLVQARLPRLVSFANAPANVEFAKVDASAPAFPEARVIPANLVTSSATTKMRATLPADRPHRAAQKLATVNKHSEAPSLIRTSTEQPPQIAPAIFVVMQTQEFEGPNATRWTFCVWRVTVISPAPKRIETGVIAKST